MISLKEIRKKYRVAKDSKTDIDWWQRAVLGNIAVIFTKLFLYTHITPDQITFLWIIVGISGGMALMMGSYWLSIIGALLIQFYFILDLTDGPVARYRNIKSFNYRSSFVHIMGHNIIDSLTFMGLTIGVYVRYYDTIWTVILGFLACISILLWDLIFSRKIRVYYRKELYKKENVDFIKKQKGSTKTDSLLHKIYERIFNIFRGSMITNFIMVAAIFDVLYIPLIFYGILFPIFVTIIFIYQYLRGFSKDQISLMETRLKI